MYFAPSWNYVLCPGHAPIVHVRMLGRACGCACTIRVHLHFFVSLRSCLRFASNEYVTTDCQYCFCFCTLAMGMTHPQAEPEPEPEPEAAAQQAELALLPPPCVVAYTV